MTLPALTTSAQRGISRCDQVAEGLRRGRHRHGAFDGELLRHVGQRERLVDLGVEPRHDGGRGVPAGATTPYHWSASKPG